MEFTKRRDYPFMIGSTVYDYAHGQVIPDYVGRVRIGDALFDVSFDLPTGQQAYVCLDSAYFA